MKKYTKFFLILFLSIILFCVFYISFTKINTKTTNDDNKSSQHSIWVENWKSYSISEVGEPIDMQIPYYDFQKSIITETSLSIPDVENVKILNYSLKTDKFSKYNLNTLNIKITFMKPGKYNLSKIQFTHNSINEIHNIGNWSFDVKPKNSNNDLNIISYSIGIISQEDIKHDSYYVTVKNISNKDILLRSINYDFNVFSLDSAEFSNGVDSDNNQWNKFDSTGVLIKPEEIKTLKIGYNIKDNINFNYYFKPALIYKINENEEKLLPLLGRLIAREPNETYLQNLQTKK